MAPAVGGLRRAGYVDSGLRIAKSALRGTATDPQMGFGKLGYMAPEQLIRGGMVDYRQCGSCRRTIRRLRRASRCVVRIVSAAAVV